MTTEQQGKKGPLFCPYCDVETTAEHLPYCHACGVTIFYCPQCRQPVARGNRVCPHCRAEIRDTSRSEEE